MKMSLPEARYAGGEALSRFSGRVEERLRGVPGVKAAAVAISLPLELGADLPFTIEDINVPKTETGVGNAEDPAPAAPTTSRPSESAPDGRLFDARDQRSTLQVALINEAAARRYFKGERAVGKRITLGQSVRTRAGRSAPARDCRRRRRRPRREPARGSACHRLPAADAAERRAVDAVDPAAALLDRRAQRRRSRWGWCRRCSARCGTSIPSNRSPTCGRCRTS